MSDGIYETVYVSEDDIIKYCRKKLYPETVFSAEELHNWAIENGYIKEPNE